VNKLKAAALEVQEYVRLTAAAMRGIFTPPHYRHDIIEQLDAVGIQSLTVVLLTGFFTGAVLALQSGLTLDQFGARPVVGRLVSASMIKELGPVLTGLMLTASTLWMGGRFYTFLTTVHALTVIIGLMYLPFGKLFHIFQRPANLGVHFYRQAGSCLPAEGPGHGDGASPRSA